MSKKTMIIIGMGSAATLLIVLFLYFRLSASSNLTKIDNIKTDSTMESNEIRIEQLEQAVANLIKQVDSLSGTTGNVQTVGGSSGVGSANFDARFNSIESTLANLLVTVNQIKQPGSQTTTTSTATPTNVSKSPLYIPLGWTGSASSIDWSSVTGQSIIIDPGDYPGYTSMQFEASIQVFQGNGTAYARLYDSDDSLIVSASDVSTTSEAYTWVSSATFKLPSVAKKTYILQLKTPTTYASMIQNARIRVNF